MSFKSWLAALFRDKTEINVSDFKSTETEFLVDAYAIFTVVDFVAALMSKVEFQTFYNGEQLEGLEWYSLNVRPNRNQNAIQFWREFWGKLLYEQEVLVVPVGEQKIIADSFNHHPEFGLLPDRFEQVNRGDLTFQRSFSVDEVFYLKYSNVDVTAIIGNMMGLYSKLISQSEEIHQRAGGERGILSVNAAATGPEDFEKKYGNWINNRFKSYFQSKNAVMPLFRGMTYTGKTADAGSSSVSDIDSLVNGAVGRAANAYKVPPAVLRGEVAGMSDAFDVLLTTCIDPLAELISTEITAKEFTAEQAMAGCRVTAFTNNIKHTDIFDVATNFDKLFADGFSFNDLMGLLNMPKKQEPWADEHHITKNYANTLLPKGDEGNE